MSYPGGKAGAGVYQRIINLIPPHRVYIEPFVGGGAVLRRKRPARSTIAVDRDEDVAARIRTSCAAMPGLTVLCDDAISFLRSYAWRGDEFVYCDPPYVLSTRRSGPRYRFELSDAEHLELLSVLLAIPAGVMLSGYRSRLYDEPLRDWHRVDYLAVTRGGTMAPECLWLNYAPPALLHDTRYVGADFRDRERIKRKRRRWVRRLLDMPPLERSAIFTDMAVAMRSLTVDGDAAGSRLAVEGDAPGPIDGAAEARATPGTALRSATSAAAMEAL